MSDLIGKNFFEKFQEIEIHQKEQSQHTQTDDYDPEIREHENRKPIENSIDFPQSENEANDQTQNGQKESNNIDASKKLRNSRTCLTMIIQTQNPSMAKPLAILDEKGLLQNI